jgi:hypothetical protein
MHPPPFSIPPPFRGGMGFPPRGIVPVLPSVIQGGTLPPVFSAPAETIPASR